MNKLIAGLWLLASACALAQSPITYITPNNGDVVYVPTWGQRDALGAYHIPAGKEILYLHLNPATGYYELWSCEGTPGDAAGSICNAGSQTAISTTAAFKTAVCGGNPCKSIGRAEYTRDGQFILFSYQDNASTLAGYGTVSVALSATVNTSSTGNTVTWVSGGKFDHALINQTITINSVAYTVATWVSATSITLTTSPGNQTGVTATAPPYCTGDPGIGCDHHIGLIDTATFTHFWQIPDSGCTINCGSDPLVNGTTAAGTRNVPVNGTRGGWFPIVMANGTTILWTNIVCVVGIDATCTSSHIQEGSEVEGVTINYGTWPTSGTPSVTAAFFINPSGSGGITCAAGSCTANTPQILNETESTHPFNSSVFYVESGATLIQNGNTFAVSLAGSGASRYQFRVCPSPFTDAYQCQWNEHNFPAPDGKHLAVATTSDTAAQNGNATASPALPGNYPPYQELSLLTAPALPLATFPQSTSPTPRFTLTSFNTPGSVEYVGSDCHVRFAGVTYSPNGDFILLNNEETKADGTICTGGHGTYGYVFALVPVPSIAITAPTSGQVENNSSGEWLLTASLTSMPNASEVKFFINNRFECETGAIANSQASCAMHNEPWTDYNTLSVTATAYTWDGSQIATSPAVSFSVRNYGLVPVNSFSQSITNVSGSLTWSFGSNATSISSATSKHQYIDGDPSTSTPASYTASSNLNTTTNEIMVPIMPYYTGQQLFWEFRERANFAYVAEPGPSCTGSTLCSSGAIQDFVNVYAAVIDGNHLKLADSAAHAATCAASNTNCIIFSSQGSSTAMIGLAGSEPWLTGGAGAGCSDIIDTTYFLNGPHKFTCVLNTNVSSTGVTFTLTFASTAVNVGSNLINVTNHPFVENESVALTTTGSLPGGITSPCTIHVIDANNFNCQGQTITTQGSGNDTGTATTPLGQYDPTFVNVNYVYNFPTIGTDSEELTFNNASTPAQLRSTAGKDLYCTSGQNITLGMYYVNTDWPATGATTAVTATSLLYGTEDSSIATVSTSGVITCGAATPPKNAWITILDPATKRYAQVLIHLKVNLTTFKHLSVGHGILSTYTPGQSIFSVTMFNEDYSTPCYYPYPFTSPAPWMQWSGINVITGIQQTSMLGQTTYPNWLTQWQGADIGCNQANANLATIQNSLTVNGHQLPGLGFSDQVCGGMVPLYNTSANQQAWSTMFNDLAPNLVGVEACDETDSYKSRIGQNFNGFSSGNDGINYNSACTTGTCGLQTITVTGCPATPCVGTAMVSYPTYNFITNTNSSPVYIWGATAASSVNLNGAYWIPPSVNFQPAAVNVGSNLINIPNHHLLEGEVVTMTSAGNWTMPGGLTPPLTVHVIDANNISFQGQTITTQGADAAGQALILLTINPDLGDGISTAFDRTLSFAIQTKDVLNGTYSADATLQMSNACTGYMCGFVEQSRCTIGAGGCASQIVVAAGVGTVSWTAHGLAVNNMIGLTASTFLDQTGAEGFYTVSSAAANTFTVNMPGIANGTYTSGSIDILFDPAPLQSVPYNMSHTWPTGAKPPFAFPLTAGGKVTAVMGYATSVDYNSVYQSWSAGDSRFGSTMWDNYSGSNNYANILDYPGTSVRGPGFNYFPDAPFGFEATVTARACNQAHSPDFRCLYNLGKDYYNVGDNNAWEALNGIMMPIVRGLAAQIRFYAQITHFQLLSNMCFTCTPTTPNAGQQQGINSSASATDLWMGMAEGANWSHRHEEAVLSPNCSAPDYGKYIFTGCRKVQSTGAYMVTLLNMAEDSRNFTCDLTPWSFGASGTQYMEQVTIRGTVLTVLAPTTTTAPCNLAIGDAITFFFEPSGKSSLTTYTFAQPSGNPAHYYLAPHYYMGDDILSGIDCAFGCTVPIDNGATAATSSGQPALSKVGYEFVPASVSGAATAPHGPWNQF